MWYMHDVGWGSWPLMSLGMIVFWGLVVYGVARLLRDASSSAPARQATTQRPADILRRRLAEGEITSDEYERLRRVIDDQPREPAAR